ncbi:MAG: DUF5106 domain-containing protein [Prevotellaceae bacterium]|jgi:thiol-disulfide isomerase/thioredoxin|nr:DUF5106 domain-containing protein [Prevotellaceae bacterium]
MKKINLFFVLIFSVLFSANAFSAGYQIDVTAAQKAGEDIYLAGYFNGKVYAFDTLKLNDKGKGVFADKKALDEGLYLVYFNANRYYEFMVGAEQHLKVKIDTTKAENGFEISGAPQTDAFVAMGNYMSEKRREQEILIKKLEEAGNDSLRRKAVEKQMEALDDEVIAYQTSVAEANKGKVMGLFIDAMTAPRLPEDLRNGNGNDNDFLMRRYQYSKNHYWDNVNLADRRIWRLNFMTQKLDNFTQKMIFQIPDSIAPEAIKLIEAARPDSVSYQLMTNYLINYSITSKIMGMDKVFVEIARRYYLSGLAPWADSTTIKNIQTEVRKVQYNLIGMKGANLPLQKLDGTKFNLYDVNADFTLAIFYEPSCGHCRETLPKIHNVYEKFKDRSFEVVAVYMLTDKKEWTDFLDKNKFLDWTNAWDPDRESYYWQFYDTSTTPGVYLLDKDKKIIAKKFDAESLERILNFELNKKEEK